MSVTITKIFVSCLFLVTCFGIPTLGQKKNCYYEDIPKLDIIGKAGFDQNEVLELQKLNLKYNLGNGRYSPKITPGKEWRDKFVNTIISIAKNVCPDQYVSHKYINLMKNYILFYLKAADGKNKKTANQNDWEQFNNLLTICLEKASNTTGDYSTVGNFLSTINSRVSGVPIEAVEDDSYPELDLVVDTFWNFYLISVGTCYPIIPRTEWLVEYFYAFKDDVLGETLLRRWAFPGDAVQRYGLFMGDMDITANFFNLRAIAVNTHATSYISDRLTVRPLYLDDQSGFEPTPNHRTPEILGPEYYLD